jgi:hypothetical protein
LPLCITNALSGGSTQFSSFAFWSFRRSGCLGTATGEHSPEFGNLRVDVSLLFLETENGGVDDLRGEVASGHLSYSDSIDGERRHDYTSVNLPTAKASDESPLIFRSCLSST